MTGVRRTGPVLISYTESLRCYTLVVDSLLWERYIRQLNRFPGDLHVGTSLLRTLNMAARRAGKMEFRGEAQRFPEEEDIPAGSQDDVLLVRLAVETRATLVTTDEALRDDLGLCGVQEKYELRVLAPGEALSSL